MTLPMTCMNDELANGVVSSSVGNSTLSVIYHLAFLPAHHSLPGDLACSMPPSQRLRCQIEGSHDRKPDR